MNSRLLLTRRGFAGAALAFGTGVPPERPVWLITQVAELTGGLSADGDSWRNGVELAVQEINAADGLAGRLVQLVTFDAQSTPGGARVAMAKALEGNPLAVLGPAMAAPARGALAVNRGGLPWLLGSGASGLTGPAHPCVFATVPPDTAMMARMAGFLREEGRGKRLTILFAETFRERAGLLADAAKAAGLEVQATANTGIDLIGALARVTRPAPDTVALLLPPGEAGRVAALVHEMSAGIGLIGTGALADPKEIAGAGPAAEGMRVHTLLADDPAMPELGGFAARYAARNKDAPDELALSGYAAMAAVRAAAARMTAPTPGAVCTALRGMAPSAAVLGGGWDAAGTCMRPSWIVEIRQGKPVPIRRFEAA